MFEYTKEELNIIAKECNFIRDTLEKVIRLIKILDFINTNSQIKEKLVLKGGTAINLSVLELPRLSVDIDLDYMDNISREQMLLERKIITSKLKRFFEMEDYVLSPKSKSRHSLDSFVLNYINSAGVNDNIKVEINYSLRSHLFECIHKKIKLKNALAALQPVLHKGSKIELELYKKIVKKFVAKVINIDDKEREFLDLFKQRIYKPELLFSDEYILKNIKNHPMVMWKLNENKIERPIINQILN